MACRYSGGGGVVSSAHMHMYAVHSTRTESMCGMGMRGDGVQKRGADAGLQISTEGERGREEEEAGDAEDG